MRAARALIGTLLVIVLLAPASASALCLGDCDGAGEVTISELILAVNLALNGGDLSQCPDGGFGNCQSGLICINELVGAVTSALGGCPEPLLPPLASSIPVAGAGAVPRTQWIRLQFEADVDPGAAALLHLACGEAEQVVAVSTDGPTLVLNPAADLPPGAVCSVTWPDHELTFTVAGAGDPATVLYDRSDPRRTSPFPDDFWTEADESSNTGIRVTMPLPEGPTDLQNIFRGLLPETNRLDGFSPIAHFVIELSDAPDADTLPLTPADSLDPFATVGLFDLTSGSSTYGQRVPFRIQPRTDTSFAGVTTHSLLIFPSIPLTPAGRYGLIITRRVLVDPTRPFGMSEYLSASLDAAAAGQGAGMMRAGQLAGGVIVAVGLDASPRFPIDRNDVALALQISVRSTDIIASDPIAMKAQVLDAPPPAYQVTSIEPQADSSPLAAVVRGTWQAPEWRSGNPLYYLARDDEGGPVQTGTKAIPFTLALPKAALDGPVPIAMYQHGNPGSSEAEVPSAARRSLASDGFAVIGFTDVLNRELSAGITDPAQAIEAQVAPVLAGILGNSKVPEFWTETRGEMLAFLRMFDGLGTLDVLPVGAPDGVPELDVDTPRVYLGISEGGNNGQGFLPYAPEIKAGALVVGGARLGEVLIHQGAELFLNVLGALFQSLTPTDIWVGISLFQTIHDHQDPHNHVHWLYRDRLEVAGTMRKPSVLVTEGLDDTLVPNHTTDSMAWSMGPIPHVQPVQRAVPFLAVETAPISGNIDAETTAAFYQYVPAGAPGIAATPGCESQPEGHYCAQTAPAALHQRTVFFQSALTGVPVIIDPLAEPLPGAAFLQSAEPPAR